MRSLLHFLRLIRIVNCLLAGAGVMIGAHATWVVPQWTPALLTALAAFLICAAGNVLNDLVDIPIDRINRPDRVLVRGLFSRQAVLLAVVILNLGAVGVALLVNSHVALTVSGSGILLLLYNLRFKRMLLTGNLAVALLAGLTFLVGGMAINSKLAFTLPGPLVPAVFAFVLHVVREIVKDVYDLEGDRAAGLRTLPLVHGVSTALAVAGGLSILLVVLLLVPVAYDWYGRLYEVGAVYVIGLPLLALVLLVWASPTPGMLKTTSNTLKLAMFLGMLLFLAL